MTTTADGGTTPPEIAPPGLAMATSAPELDPQNALDCTPEEDARYARAMEHILDYLHPTTTHTVTPQAANAKNALMNLDDRECSVCECTCPTGWHRCPESRFGPGESCLTQAEYDQKMYGYTDE